MLESVIKAFSSLEQVEAIALGGSRAGTHYDEKSDYDIYLYCTEPVPEEGRSEIYKTYAKYVELGNAFWELEDNGTFINGVDFDIVYRNLDDFVAGVARVVEHCQPSNGYTTCMWHNLTHCKILYDRDGRLADAQHRFSVPYPAQLKKNILERNWKLLRDSMPAYQFQILKAVQRNDQVSINHRTAAFLESYFDILFALNEKTHPGEKRLVELCIETCTLLPDHLSEYLSSLFFHMFTQPELVPEDLERILEALGKILAKM